ncbi:Uma2 family endonuclease [Streptomyces chrestomyceticus]|uniref:Uma2 family endonuclease n=1 Tax=Streptomyces chrestomyceticus TaxID=68185 RepID=UPI0019D0BDAF|nr:Uma2 family endonuclease [Streptomyces chrestomyceticus]
MTLMLERQTTERIPHDPAWFPRVLGDLLSIDVPAGHRAEIVAESAFDTDEYHLDGQNLSLAVELTCPVTRHHDYGDKLATYGKAGVPVYLLVDMEEQRTTVFWEPGEDGYTARESAAFGEELRVPALFAREPGRRRRRSPHTPRNRNTASTRR